MRRKSSIPVENKAAKEAAKNKMFAALSRKTGLTAKEVNIHIFYFNFFNKKNLKTGLTAKEVDITHPTIDTSDYVPKYKICFE